jgi:hypothetical protein
MSFYTGAPPTAASFEAALRFIFEAWAALPAPEDSPPDPADLELHMAFTRWREVKERAGR